MYAVVDHVTEAAQGSRLSNRTAAEVLTQLKRPSSPRAVGGGNREGKLQVEQGTPNLQGANTRNREGGRFVRRAGQKKPRRSDREGSGPQNDVTSMDIDSENTLSIEETEYGRGTYDTAAQGKKRQEIQILSSDQSSDECIRTKMKHSRKPLAKQTRSRIPILQPKERSTGLDFKSPSRSIA